jgi:hypothetical protein
MSICPKRTAVPNGQSFDYLLAIDLMDVKGPTIRRASAHQKNDNAILHAILIFARSAWSLGVVKSSLIQGQFSAMLKNAGRR